MASTNKTTHYELSQYIGTDKPAYLTDYNQDMSRIDAGIYGAKSLADVNESAIGTLANLSTTAKTDLVSAINEVDGDVATNTANISTNTSNISTNTTNIGNLSNLTTASKTNLVVASNEINSKVGNINNLETNIKTSTVEAINEIVENFNFTSFASYTGNDFTSTGSLVSAITGTLNVATNSDGSIFKVYSDSLLVNIGGSGSATISVNTNIRPTENINIVGAGTLFDEDSSRNFLWVRGASFSVDTNGVLTISLNKDFNDSVYQLYIFNPCLYFAKNFGDVPSPTP